MILLYNTGLTIYIVNSREVFRDYTPYKKGESDPIITSSGPIYAKGHGSAVFKVLYQKNLARYRTLVLKDMLYFP